MFNLFKKKDRGIAMPEALTREAAAEILRTSPEMLEKFESSYRKHEADRGVSDDYFQINAKQAAELSAERFRAEGPLDPAIRDAIVDELMLQTQVLHVDGAGSVKVIDFTRPALPDGKGTAVKPEDLTPVPEAIRPQLTGDYMTKDVGGDSYRAILSMYQGYRTARDAKSAKTYYDHFRQGLDLLDLDPVTYEIIDTNPISIGYWLPRVAKAASGAGLRIPDTRIAKVPITLLQLTRKDYSSLTPGSLAVADEWCRRAFQLDPGGDYFIKTGTYSSKFDFRNARVADAKEIAEIGQYLLFVHAQALAHARYDLSGSGRPVVYGMSTTVEWAVREFVPSAVKESIYHGLPLRTEFRVFVDFDRHEIIGRNPYWRPDVMLRRFERSMDSGDPDMIHDSLAYRAAMPRLQAEYDAKLPEVESRIQAMLDAHPDIHGQWSVDVMLEGDDLWLIDMALAEASAYYDSVPKELRSPSPEDWIPALPSGDD